jgi:hypothetical protein
MTAEVFMSSLWNPTVEYRREIPEVNEIAQHRDIPSPLPKSGFQYKRNSKYVQFTL